MASHDVKSIKDCAVLLANDLRSGLTVYLTKDGQWSDVIDLAWHLTDDETAEKAKRIAAQSEQNNQVVGSYLVDTSTAGEPSHIRERIRVDGPSVEYLPNLIHDLPATGTGA